MKRILGVVAALGLGLSPLGAMNGAEAADLRMLGAFPEGFVFTKELAQPFVDLVEEESGGAVSISMMGPDTVPTFEQFEPVQSGVFDMLFTHPAYHAGTTAVGLSIDAIASDPKKRRDAGIIGFIDEHYQGLGMKLIAAPATGTKGFRYYLKEPVSGEPGLSGRKIRGTVSYHPMIEALGGKGVVISGGEVYSSLQKGVVDGAAWSLNGAKDFKWHEVVDYLADPVFGQVGVMIFMNLDAWNGLSDDKKAALERAALRIEENAIARFDALAAQEKKDLIDLGMKMTSFSDAEAAQFEALWANGVWTIAEEKTPEPAAALRKLAREAGMTN
ncbi:MAG: TRAP transporter substrate-binding protein DctP [Pseudomonadota bacterium]